MHDLALVPYIKDLLGITVVDVVVGVAAVVVVVVGVIIVGCKRKIDTT